MGREYKYDGNSERINIGIVMSLKDMSNSNAGYTERNNTMRVCRSNAAPRRAVAYPVRVSP